MESKDEAAVERQKLVDDGEVEIEDDQTNVVPPIKSVPKPVQTPNSPVLSNRVSQPVFISNTFIPTLKMSSKKINTLINWVCPCLF